MDNNGRAASTPSVLALVDLSVESVTQALKQASLAVEPKKVITQSMMTAIQPPKATALADGNIFAMVSVFRKAKASNEMPQIT